MSFLWIEMLWALLVVPVLITAYILVQRRRQKYALRYASLSLVKDAIGRGPGIRRHIPAVLFLIGLATMVIAMARPTATVMLPSDEGTIILTVDVSGSMLADDLKPNRIEAAKAAARTFVGDQPRNVRIGLVSFSTNASVVQAPTTDREAVLAAIDRLVPQRSTAIGSGILTSLDAIFEQPGAGPTLQSDSLASAAPPPTPTSVPHGTYAPAIVVLLSDGASNIGPPPIDAAKQAADRGVRVYTVGVGDPNGVILRIGGRSARVRLDEETLKSIAQATDGKYFRADTESNLDEIYKSLSTQLVFKPQQTEITAGFTGAAAVLMLVAGGLSLLWFSRLP
jgi:Ca-activated chloride channel family protein